MKPKTKRNSLRFKPEERRQKFLKAADKLFLENGYAETSLNDVIRVAGGSKATLIEQFQNKAGLFAAVLERSAISFAESLKLDLTASPQETLQLLGESILRFYLSRMSLLAYRGVIAAGPHEPAIARAFYMRGHEVVVRPIADRLRTWHQQGLIEAIDFHAEADRFTHMLRNGIYEQHLLGMTRHASTQSIKDQVSGAVRTLLAGIGSRKSR